VVSTTARHGRGRHSHHARAVRPHRPVRTARHHHLPRTREHREGAARPRQPPPPRSAPPPRRGWARAGPSRRASPAPSPTPAAASGGRRRGIHGRRHPRRPRGLQRVQRRRPRPGIQQRVADRCRCPPPVSRSAGTSPGASARFAPRSGSIVRSPPARRTRRRSRWAAGIDAARTSTPPPRSSAPLATRASSAHPRDQDARRPRPGSHAATFAPRPRRERHRGGLSDAAQRRARPRRRRA
jgi:hypothetical protein